MNRLQQESIKQSKVLKCNTIAYQSYKLGLVYKEPLLYAMDGMLRYAKAYKKHFENNLANDSVLGENWLSAVKGLRGLLNGNGVVAMEKDITTDSKDNGLIEGIFWDAIKVAGFTEGDI